MGRAFVTGVHVVLLWAGPLGCVSLRELAAAGGSATPVTARVAARAGLHTQAVRRQGEVGEKDDLGVLSRVG